MIPPEAGGIEDVASAFEQAETALIAVEGPRLVLTAWNEAGRRMAGPLMGSLGTAVADNEFLRGTQLQELLLKVYATGQPFSGSTWRLALPDAHGAIQDHFLDFTYAPWRWPDGSIRGVVANAIDVTDAVLSRQALERESAGWEERFRSSRDAMRVLQASLLPSTVPVVPGVQLGARYLLAEADTSAGGDWFSAIALSGGRIALAVGDVVGHGLGAAATMGQLRAVLEERVADGAGVASSLQALEQSARRIPGADAATVCLAILDTQSGELEYCTAGHPPPLLVDGNSWRYLPLTGSQPLGSDGTYLVQRAIVPPDGLLVLYSDGLVERPGRTWQESMAEIGDAVGNALAGRPVRTDAPTNAADRVCVQSVEVLTRTTGFTDDITVLAAHRVAPPAPLHVALPAASWVVMDVVTELERWLDAIDAGEEDQRDLRLAVVELVTNSVEHGLRDRADGQLGLDCELSADGVSQLLVTDDGKWREASADELIRSSQGVRMARGLGLPLVGQLVDELQLDHDTTGTRVQLRRRLSRRASLLDAEPASPPRPTLDQELLVSVLPEDPGTLQVSGPVLHSTAESLRTSLDVRTHGGTRSTTVDLSFVTHLTSDGVRVLEQTRRTSQLQGVKLVLVATPESVAHHVLTLVGMPHLTSRSGRASA